MKRAMASTHYVRLTTFDDSTYFVFNAEEPYEARISQRLTGNTISNISLAPSAQPCSALKIATTSTKAKSIVITTILPNSPSDVLDARPLFSSNLWRYFEMGKTNIGTLNAT